jgi:nicotinamidase-related amidase
MTLTPSSRLTARLGGLLLVDFQTRLLNTIRQSPRVVANASRLARAASELNIPTWATEQYPKGLGPTCDEIVGLVPSRFEKTSFSCCGVLGLVEQIQGRGLRHITLAGVEAHVCVAQTALDLLALGLVVQIPADAVASRAESDAKFAMRRLERAGAVITTTEAVLFEWVEDAGHPSFKMVSGLVKSFEPPPDLDLAATGRPD